MHADTLHAALASGTAEATAIRAPGRAPLTYGALRALLGETLQTLRSLGAARNDRVAIVLPNGPEMAVSFLAAASGCTAAPLNPAYRAEEFEFYLSDLAARLLIVEAGKASPAIEVARRLGVPIAQLHPDCARGSGHVRACAAGRRAASRRRTCSAFRAGGHRLGPAHLGNDFAAQDRAAVPAQHLHLRPQRARHARPDRRRPRPERHAPVSHPRAHRRSAGAAVRGRPGVLHAGFRRAALLPLDRGSPSDVVHGGADHAPDDPGARRQSTRR